MTLHDEAHFRPAFLQEQRVEHCFLQAHRIIFNKYSRAGAISVFITGVNFPSLISKPQVVGARSTLLKLIQTFIWWYTLRP